MTAITDSSNHKTVLHGVLVNVDGIGVLITGESGTGKSECALELIARRGHRLVADDVVEVTRIGDTLSGRAPKRLAGLINLPGLGIVSVGGLFGNLSVEPEHSIDLCIQFETGAQLEKHGSESEILGLRIPRIAIPHCHSRILSLLVETAVKILKNGGKSVEIEFLRKHDELLVRPSSI